MIVKCSECLEEFKNNKFFYEYVSKYYENGSIYNYKFDILEELSYVIGIKEILDKNENY